ncbi:2140_t:CDS:2, partial [Racocetra persica]
TTSISDYTKKGSKDTDFSLVTNISDDDFNSLVDSVSSEGFTFNSNFQVKVVIKIKKSDLILAKWFIFELDNFDIFQNNLIKHIQDRINNNHIDKNDVQVSYKINGHGQAMALDDKNDYNAFITNIVPKESKLNSDEIELANIITQIRTKYQCNIHTTSCYIEDDKHLALIPTHLQLWTQDIKNKLTTIKTPSLYPTFGIINAIKANTQIPQLQSPSVVKLNSGSIPSLQEFFEELDKNYNGNDAYLDLKAEFE